MIVNSSNMMKDRKIKSYSSGKFVINWRRCDTLVILVGSEYIIIEKKKEKQTYTPPVSNCMTF